MSETRSPDDAAAAAEGAGDPASRDEVEAGAGAPLGDDEAAPAASEPARSGAGPLAWAAILVAWLGVGGALGAAYRVHEQLEVESSRFDPDLVALRERQDRLAAVDGDLAASIDALRDRLERADRAAEERVAALRADLNDLSRTVQSEQEVQPGEWQMAELAYLLRIANHRLQLEHDVRGALTLLEAASDLVESIDDFALFEIRTLLAQEREALRAMGRVDPTAIFLRLQALIEELDELPLRVPRFDGPDDRSTVAARDDGEGPDWTERLFGLVDFRVYRVRPDTPVLAPDDATYLRLNLRLMLEQAQLALLEERPEMYRRRLETAREWLATYFEAGTTQHVQEELADLASLRVEPELPDISGSYRALQEYLREDGTGASGR